MAKVFWNGSTLLGPVPPALVTCGTMEQPNAVTVAWTGIVCTHPPMTYISLRPSRYSYDIIEQSGEFVINLTTTAICKQVDFCGVKSGRDMDKIKACGLHIAPMEGVSAPLLEEAPLSLACVVKQKIPLGTHDMFLAEIVRVAVEEKYIDSKGKLNLQQGGLAAYAHGEYFALGRKLGSFGFSVKKKKSHPKQKPIKDAQ
ncbi:MAG: flavin reductase family protein [Oscillospiraceae bacterium]